MQESEYTEKPARSARDMACCQQDGCPEARELLDMADDPTLQGCCRKDLQQQARAAQIKTSLLAVDPSQAKQKLQQQVISTQPHKEDFDSNSDAGSLHLAKLHKSCVTGLHAEGTAGYM